jgi:hypothetical protein
MPALAHRELVLAAVAGIGDPTFHDTQHLSLPIERGPYRFDLLFVISRWRDAARDDQHRARFDGRPGVVRPVKAVAGDRNGAGFFVGATDLIPISWSSQRSLGRLAGLPSNFLSMPPASRHGEPCSRRTRPSIEWL